MLAVDPSSPFSGGALLGDRVRMGDHATDDGVFIRSMATRGHLGGLAWATPQALRVLDAAGCDVVLVETVGVGQSEVDVVALADTTVVLLAPGMGDGVQAAKAGILEIGDVFVVNKADRDGARQTVRELKNMLSLRDGSAAWSPPVLSTVAVPRRGSGQGRRRRRRALRVERADRRAGAAPAVARAQRDRGDRAGPGAHPDGGPARRRGARHAWPTGCSPASWTPTRPPTSCCRAPDAAALSRSRPRRGGRRAAAW